VPALAVSMLALSSVSSLVSYRVAFFSAPPPLNFSKSQAHYKFLDLENFGGGRFLFARAGFFEQFGGGGGAEKKTTL
jgi:hypothetical protein